MKIGDFVLIDFVGRITGTNEIFDLTDEALAKKENVHNPEQKYGPALVIVGAKMIVLGLEEELIKMKEGEEKEVLVKPENGFGQRNPKLTRIVSTANFVKQKITPFPGMHVTIDNMHARVQSVSGGRVMVDFNNPLAGKELLYRVKIVKEIKDTKEKTVSLLDYYSIKAEINLEADKLTIKLEKRDTLIEKIVSETIKKWIKEIKDVKFEPEEKSKGTNKA